MHNLLPSDVDLRRECNHMDATAWTETVVLAIPQRHPLVHLPPVMSPFKQYQNVNELFSAHGIFRRREGWRLINPPVMGEVHALPHIRGRLVATDGVHGLVELYDSVGRPYIFEAHLGNFKKDPSEPEVDVGKPPRQTMKRKETPRRTLSSMLQKLLDLVKGN